MNDYQFKLVKLHGDFVWHDHRDTDEAFIVLEGRMTIEFRDGEVALTVGEMFVVPRGVEHKPSASQEAQIMMFEAADTANTGNVDSDRTLKTLERI